VNSTYFSAYAVTNEIDLNRIAVKCGIPKKYTWEEPLIIKEQTLNTILGKVEEPSAQIMVFSFGSVIFINCDANCIDTFIQYLKTFKKDIALDNYTKFFDNYELRIDEHEEFQVTDEYITAPEEFHYMVDLISIVIAKSVALEKTEDKLSIILDSLEHMIDKLEKYNLKVSNKELAQTTSKIIRHEYNTIAHIMILDKPSVTWDIVDAENFYNKLSVFFELNERYQILKEKTKILNSIIDNFSSISLSIRGLFVEWLIVLLIVVEVILMLIDLFT
jgi:uncharacterized Rmd1/YagE family protein